MNYEIYLKLVPKKITDKEIKDLVNDFRSGILLKNLVKSYGYSKTTINKYLKKNIEEKEYKNLTQSQIFENATASNNHSAFNHESCNFQSEFYELEPVEVNIDQESRKELSSIPLNQINLPPMVYMIVEKNIELKTKLLKEYASWQFLPEDDLNRKTIEIFFDMKIAKSMCNKDQKVIKIPNTKVFHIVAPILLSRGITRIVSQEQLITI